MQNSLSNQEVQEVTTYPKELIELKPELFFYDGTYNLFEMWHRKFIKSQKNILTTK